MLESDRQPQFHWLNIYASPTAGSLSGFRLWLPFFVLALAVAIFALPGSAGAKPGNEKLTGVGSATRWAHPKHVAPVRFRPAGSARRVTSTHKKTEDGFPEVYLAMRSKTNRKGQTWIRIRVPMRPNGRTGWVRRYALGPLYQVNTRLVVNRARGRAKLLNYGRRIWKAPVGTGAPGTPTPGGNFWVREKFRTGERGGLYGPVAFGTSNYSVLSDWPGGGVVGIHGTNEPGLIPGTPSHGCIRVRNKAALRLFKLMPVGTPVFIR